ncbi:MAG: SRPBCC domain-containing protein [Corynebacterium sp.]|uniref:SRPBCC domain-containing protein n=1 Tax=Corynebacterium sp. TaxID=1720 RepID=UPI0026DF83F3|nr:SRPBCC domain-containing protein [Corynebacterium sp.]MDO5669677.1 SRPBCC domain-containing protein [Corynebacterium sp.]
MTTREPTGYLSTGPVWPELIITRRIAHVIDAVWNQITDPELLDTWYGTFAGDPAGGEVTVTTHEVPDAPGTARIDHCEAPHALAVTLQSPAGEWVLSVTLSAEGDDTDLEFRQRLDGLEYAARDLGPGWEYYLDKLVMSLAGEDVATLQWDDYHPVLCEHYDCAHPEEPGQMPEEN